MRGYRLNRADPDDAGRRIRQTTRLRSDRRGAIAILAAMSLLMLVTASAMALDVANLYLAQSTNQWIADQSALAAAFAYSQSGNSLTTAQNAASSMAVVNGAGSATVNATIGASPSGDGHNALKVVVTLPVTLSPFGRTIAQAGATSITVSATAYAELHTTTPCIVALAKSSAGGTGISATSSNVTATGCEMASNYTVTSTSGAHVTAASIYAVGSISASSGGTLTGSQFPSSSAQSDPFASSSVFSRMASVAALTAPSFPAVGSAPSGGSTMTCSGTLTVPSGSHSTITIGSGCTTVNFTGGAETDISGSGLSVSNSTATLNFAAGTYKINGITVGNSSTGTVTINATGTVVFDIWSGITLSGAAVLKVNGPATYNVQGYGITNNSSGAMTFNNSRGASTSTFFVAGGISLPYGPGTFPNGSYTIENSAGNGLSVGSNMTVTFGNGSYVISGQTGGINVGSSGHLTIGSQIDSSSVFQITGIQYSYDDAIYTNGNSSLTIGSFTNLDINGAVALNSTVSFGAGIYTINGAFSACTSGGSLSGTNVSFIASGAICFGAGFSSVNLTAPTAIDGSTVGSAATIALASNSSTASAVTSGAVSTVVEGAVYLPHATLTISGGGNLNGGGNCLQVVASSLTFSNDGNGVSTSCASLGGSAASATITLVQ
jgi:hypothetical protein